MRCTRSTATRSIARGKGELMRVDLRCYAIVDPEVAGGHDLADLCAHARRRRRDAGAAARQASATRASWSSARARSRRRSAARAARDQRPRRRGARGRMPTACMSAGTTWRRPMRGGCSGRDAIIGLSSTAAQRRRRAPTRAARLCRHRRRLRHDLEGQPRIRRSASPACARSCEALRARAARDFRSARIAGINAGQCRAGDRGRRRRRVGDLGAVARRRIRARPRASCARRRRARSRSGARA